MMRFAKVFCLPVFLLISANVLSQNPNYSAYFTYTTTYNADGSVTVTPTAEITGSDDIDDWAE